ncbi:hypothetical protein LUZ61_017327 [Rhynchospora tenuis]|uniref:RecA family profile 1 domain-containing protein n=1 Tax=Rhynchospora tenuis TaxID=198213 RepID=A0AAD5Z763_9POAL|nr:hypothetical protein LUZ61_017327 [Rhynchospora tenuis]
MANKLISQMGLPPSLSHIFSARNILTAKDALSLPEVDLMALLDIEIDLVRSAVAHISEATCPPFQTGLALLEEKMKSGGHLSTLLPGLDNALCGGIPFGALTELVGPSGIGKTQFCLKLALLAALPECYGGLNGRVIYIDTESKFSSRRMIEIGEGSFPQIFRLQGLAQKMAGRIIVTRPTSISEFNDSLQQMKLTLLQNEVKLLIVDSIAALVSWDNEKGTILSRQSPLRGSLSFLKSIAEFSQIPVVLTNQVRSHSSDDTFHYIFQGHRKDTSNSERSESHLTAALGIQWAHAVTIRLIFEAHSGHRFIKVAKSPISPPVAFPFVVESSGITLLNQEGISVAGSEINAIRCQGCNVLTQ